MAFYKFLSCGLVFPGSELRTRKFERERERGRERELLERRMDSTA